MGDNKDETESMQLTHTKKRNNLERGGKVNSKVRMEQELELDARAESHQATQRKTARTNQTLPVSRDTNSCQIETGRNRKPGKENRVVERWREREEGCQYE